MGTHISIPADGLCCDRGQGRECDESRESEKGGGHGRINRREGWVLSASSASKWTLHELIWRWLPSAIGKRVITPLLS